ncbi:hypothetical protein A3A39_00130 [Candidatus Kaiserbacteria bacterium RIFCSPLOWO2_01_FULL_54_13]|uniref:DUF192 domain-containing protein n=1 Tax=Candidatus Kaiserbacteria bacterium RIFCSPLOWO2_01_FULL_54_13 TaxID=1798512 RepID=A0A1F6F4G6_9BACT|nr:MAG: hypothetical protein A3A39_00130 [Candidatus Kaiserbacteria bacterium RIFCSPLOWO2_01_FULL_54_13]
MKQTLSVALLLAACAILISLVYTKLPGLPSADISATNTLAVASSTVQLNDRTVRVTVADSNEERERGLSGRGGLAPDEGMLFIFPEDGVYSFWMKDMRFAIDILWISREGVVVDVRENVSPETFPAVFEPRIEARYVLELPAGWVKEYSVEVGDVVRL